jgi:tRNA uridine 5-carbamoylmethylation protein Kti12
VDLSFSLVDSSIMAAAEEVASPITINYSATITVILLVGLPGSGKSTLAQRLLREASDADKQNDITASNDAMGASSRLPPKTIVYIEYDAIEESILQEKRNQIDQKHDDDNVDQNPEEQQREAWNQARVVAMERLRDELEMSRKTTLPTTILLDDNFHLRGMRKQIHRVLLRYNKDVAQINFGILWVTCPLSHCLERNRQRLNGKVPDHVIENMHKTLEPPTQAAWEADGVLKVSSDTPFCEIVQFVKHCPTIVDLPPEPDEEQQAADRAVTLTNQVHNLDKLLRQWVGQTAKVDKKLAQPANTARKELLQRSKEGVVDSTNVEILKDAFMNLVVPLSEPMERRLQIQVALRTE